MSRWEELPNEILYEIFELVRFNFGLHELVECQLVCKSWRKYASFILYRKLVLFDCFPGEQFTECMQNSSLGSLVKEINFRCYKEDNDERVISLIHKLAETCPNVEIFEGELCDGQWDTLGEAVGRYWKQLKQLPRPDWSMDTDENTFANYYTLASVCRRTLTHIALPPTLPTSPQFTKVLPLLPSFISLTHLTVTPKVRRSTLIEFDEAIQQCPNLTCFSVNFYPGIPIETTGGDTKRYDVSSMQPHFKLKKLEADICLHQDTFDYIMHKFPNLECCNVNLAVNEDLLNHIESWLTKHYEEKLRTFQKYLSNRRCDWFFTFRSFPLIEEYLQRTTGPVVRIYARDSSWLHIKQDNITWIIDNTRESTDRLKELFKYQHDIKEAEIVVAGYHDTDHFMLALLSECKGLEKLTYIKTSKGISPITLLASNQILNSSLITLKLKAMGIELEALAAFSYAYPELRNLSIQGFCSGKMSQIDMPKTKFNHLQIHANTLISVFDEVIEAVLLQITSQKSSPKRFLVNRVAPNRIEEFTTYKEYQHKFVINCAGIDYLSLSISRTHILKKYPLLL
ncbi:hypothetical protein RMATCC62417_00979 [Rhizopus microsporus]|nr:hypothetical protein RMATCC62417_00979 [Rhizopus microsporus]